MSLFINPSLLPGGREWSAACAAAASVEDPSVAAALSTTLGCAQSQIAGFGQVLLLLLAYGYILYIASNLISEGSELLLLVPALRDIVGSIVLPVLGAVPDGCIVLFSGLGPNPQEELAIGVGAIAGSTCMLLTIPWFIAIFSGRVNILPGGHANYKPLRRGGNFDKLYPEGYMSLSKTGIAPRPIVKQNGKIMLFTAIPFVIIQTAAFMASSLRSSNSNSPTVSEDAASASLQIAESEKIPAAFCFVVTLASCAWYLHYQLSSPSAAENTQLKSSIVEKKKRKDGTVSIAVSFDRFWQVAGTATQTVNTESTPLTSDNRHHQQYLKFQEILKDSFAHYDENDNHKISAYELSLLMNDLGYRLSGDQLKNLLLSMTKDGEHEIEEGDFLKGMEAFIRNDLESKRAITDGHGSTELWENENGTAAPHDLHDDEHEEKEHGSFEADPETQLRIVIRRSLLMMATGTGLVLVFADPVVGVFSEIGARLGISPFYISFALAPLASNLSEVIAARQYARKKTSKSVTISLSTLLGAVILNNTFVLAIFMALIYLRGLAWTFAAETIGIIFVQVAAYWVSQKPVMYLKDALFVLALFPGTLFVVYFLENFMGLD